MHPQPEIQTTSYCLDGLCCFEEEQLIRKKLGGIDGITSISVNLVTKTVEIVHRCPTENLINALHEIGFQPKLHYQPIEKQENFIDRHRHAVWTILSGLFLFFSLMFYFFIPDFIAARISLSLISIVIGGWQIAIKAVKSLRLFVLDMNMLMIVAALGALGIGKWEEGAAVIVLYSLSLVLERYSTDRSRRAVRSLLNLTPTTATVLRGNEELVVPIALIAPGEELFIRPGERIALDGVVTSGYSTVNQAAITGESLPVEKSVGTSVFAGTLNERGILHVKVTKRADETTLARIVHLIEEAQSTRAPIQQFTETFARIYTPTILSLALLLATIVPFLFHESFQVWFYRALVLVVMSCPCALVISTPVTLLSGLFNAARHGILIKGGRFLEMMSKVRVIGFDKTGTLTVGEPSVSNIISLNGASMTDVLKIAAALESRSEHPLAEAIVRRSEKQRISFREISIEKFEALTGLGAKALVDGKEYFIGNHELIEQFGVCSSDIEQQIRSLEETGQTVIGLGTEEKIIGLIAISDTLRKESYDTIKDLRDEGIEHIILLTGDNDRSAQAIAHAAGISEYRANILPEEKVAEIRQLQVNYKGGIAMVGDGMNDAPALAHADVGIAMGKSSSDIALETSNIVLVDADLQKLPYLIRLGKRTVSIIHTNIVIALATKLVFIGLSIFGWSSLWLALLADDGVTLLVILNGLRLLFPQSSMRNNNYRIDDAEH